MNIFEIVELRQYIAYLAQENLFNFLITNKFLFEQRHTLNQDTIFHIPKCSACATLQECIYRDHDNTYQLVKNATSNKHQHVSPRATTLYITCEKKCYKNPKYIVTQYIYDNDEDDYIIEHTYDPALIVADIKRNLEQSLNLRQFTFITKIALCDNICLPSHVTSLYAQIKHKNTNVIIHDQIESLTCPSQCVPSGMLLPRLKTLHITNVTKHSDKIDFNCMPNLESLTFPFGMTFPITIMLPHLKNLDVDQLDANDVLPNTLETLETSYIESTCKLPTHLKTLVFRGTIINFRLPHRLRVLRCDRVENLRHCKLFSLHTLIWNHEYARPCNAFMPKLKVLHVHSLNKIDIRKLPRLVHLHVREFYAHHLHLKFPKSLRSIHIHQRFVSTNELSLLPVSTIYCN